MELPVQTSKANTAWPVMCTLSRKGMGSESGAHKRDVQQLSESGVTAVLKEAQLCVLYPADGSGRSSQA